MRKPPIGQAAHNTGSQQMQPCYLVTVTVTQLSPLLVTFHGTPNIPASKLAGATYSLGVANAITANPGQLIVLPIG